MRELRLTTGAFPVVLGLATVAALVAALGRRPRWRALGLVALTAAAGVGALRLALPASVDVARIPPSFYLWAVIPLFAVGVAGVTWRRAPARRRVAGLIAVPLAWAFAANQVNAWFAYLPTAADLAGVAVAGQMPWSRVADRPAGRAAVVRVDIPAVASGFRHRHAYIWLPPAGPGPSTPLPVVMMLAGTPGAPDNLLRAADITDIAARYARSHGGQAPLLVFPDHNGSFAGDSECVDGPRGAAETYLAVDVPRFVTAAFASRPQPWGVFGYSEGGTCALTLTLRHPDLFSAFVDIGGDMRPNLGTGPRRDAATVRELFGGDRNGWAAHDPMTLLARRRYDGVSGLFVAATGDRPAMHNTRRLVPAARAAGIDVQTKTAPGHHSFAFVAAVSPDAFGWLADRMEIAGTAAGGTAAGGTFPAAAPAGTADG